MKPTTARGHGRLTGLGASLLILMLVAGTPLLLTAVGATPWNEELSDLNTLLASPDDGTLALLVFALVAWIAWAVMAASIGVEIFASLRGVRAPRLPGLGLPQDFAARIVAAAALLFAIVPTAAPAFVALPVGAAPSRATAAAAPVAAAPAAAPRFERAPHVPTSLVSEPPLTRSKLMDDTAAATADLSDRIDRTDRTDRSEYVAYTVRRGDSLWKIALDRLGDGTRYGEIIALNQDVLHGEPDFIDPGTALRLPSDATPREDEPERHTAPTHADETYVVRPGDTLWGIAAEALGDANRYPEVFNASRAIIQRDGDHLRDPDLIRPGWQLTIPHTRPAHPPAAEPPVSPPGGRHLDPTPPPPSPTAPPPDTPTATPSVTSTPSAQTTRSPEAPPASHDRAGGELGADSQEGGDNWMLPGLVGAGALLAGAVLITIRAQRRTRQRHRRPGYTLAPPPLAVRAVEKTATTCGTPAAEVIGRLDRLLRHLAAQSPVPPRLDGVEIDDQTVTLHLAEPASLPEPWEGTDTTWVCALDSPVANEDQLPPYPLLVSVGQDSDGHLWLLDLEHLGTTLLIGEAEHAGALARHLTAELALNPWAVLAEIHTVDLAPELADLDPLRLHHHAADGTGLLERLHLDLEREQQTGLGDPEPFRAVLVSGLGSGVGSGLVGGDSEESPSQRRQALAKLAHLVRTQQSRSGFALVKALAPQESADMVLELTHDGRLRVPHLRLDLRAAGLTVDEAAACAAIVDLTRDVTEVPMPAQQDATGWRALADQAGALIPDLTQSRPEGGAGDLSLLPEPSQRYEAVAATTATDVEVLAPVVPEQTRHAVEGADPRLDADLAEWDDPESPLPKLRLLGPVTASSKGSVPPAVMERKAYFTELVTFLALHPSGVSSRQVREAFGISQSRARTDLSFIRAWFGTNARTGVPHLPPATTSPAHADRGTSGYQLNDVLVDLDLFRRLRARGQARGAEGITDLVSALKLVIGEPFSNLREPGWSWLLDDERVHETTVFAVVDVAHVVATEAFSRGDLARARFAAETGCAAAPYDEVCRLDLAKVAEADGHGDLAEQILAEHVFNRTDDQLPPIDLPERTAEVIRNHGWGNQQQRQSD